MVSLLFLPPGVATLVVGFVLFRLVDIWKPYPVGRVEKLPSASGIMADDLLAGILANLIHHVLRWGFPGWWGGG
jgi:phosphatidylglycerophosphatase A